MFQINKRGYLREGYHADMVLVNLNDPWTVDKSNLLYKCGWSPFEGTTFRSRVVSTWVNGKLVYDKGRIIEAGAGQRLEFDR
jgi:dihydroorotase